MGLTFKPYLHEHNLDLKRFIGSNGIPKLTSKLDSEWKSVEHKVQSGISTNRDLNLVSKEGR